MTELKANTVDGVEAPLPMREATATSRRIGPRDAVASWPVARIIGARDIKAKYKQSALGPLWLVLQPMGIVLALSIAFSGVTQVDTRGVPYLLFALVGVTVWNFISITIAAAPAAFTSNAALVKRSTAPRLAFISATVISNSPLLAIVLAFTVLSIALDRGFEIQALLLPVLIVWLLIFMWSVVLLIAPVAARFRDAIAVVPLLVQAGIFISPVGYDVTGAPANIKLLVSLNPVTGIIEAWRWALLGMSPQTGVIAVALGWTVLLLAAAWVIFRKMEVRLADFV